jgi:hydroxymethylpyrimidine pyrophosphatase-like HAD family hydrolase
MANLPAGRLDLSLFDGLVLAGGGEVIFKGEQIYEHKISEEMLCELCAYYLPSTKWCCFEGHKLNYGIHDVDLGLYENIPAAINSADDFSKKYKGASIQKITFGGKPLEAEQKLLENDFRINLFPDYSEGILKGDSKSKGIQLILAECNIPVEDSIAIGDSMNDMDPVQFCGTGVAVGNACDELKAAADWVSAPAGKGGVAKALEKYCD